MEDTKTLDIQSKMEKRLKERKSQGNFRELTSHKLPYDFVSNDYLGLARNEELFERIQKTVEKLNIRTVGSGGSRLLSGNHQLTERLEERLARLFQSEASLLFNSGYNANLGLLSSVAQRGDTIIYDELSHVCLKEGAWLSKAESFKFRHNDIDDLEKKLKGGKGNLFVVTESVFSMDGDQSPIEEIVSLTKKYGANLIVDEAHTTGCFGENGNGWLCEKGLANEVFARVYTFGKAVGAHGACVAGSNILIDYLINFSRPFIYTTALPIHSVVTIDEAFNYIAKHSDLKLRLNDKINYFLQLINQSGISLSPGSLSKTAIQPIVIPGNQRIKEVTSSLVNKGFDLRPILAPTVPEGTERIRLSLHVHNTKEEIESLVLLLKNAMGNE